MEGPVNNAESFENFKHAISEIYKIDGWSENLNSLIGVWHSKKQQETDMPDGTIKQRVAFQIELAEVYIVTHRLDLAFDTLSDAWIEATQEGLNDLVTKITDLMNSLNE